jgi:hypothetical protein
MGRVNTRPLPPPSIGHRTSRSKRVKSRTDRRKRLISPSYLRLGLSKG